MTIELIPKKDNEKESLIELEIENRRPLEKSCMRCHLWGYRSGFLFEIFVG